MHLDSKGISELLFFVLCGCEQEKVDDPLKSEYWKDVDVKLLANVASSYDGETAPPFAGLAPAKSISFDHSSVAWVRFRKNGRRVDIRTPFEARIITRTGSTFEPNVESFADKYHQFLAPPGLLPTDQPLILAIRPKGWKRDVARFRLEHVREPRKFISDSEMARPNRRWQHVGVRGSSVDLLLLGRKPGRSSYVEALRSTYSLLEKTTRPRVRVGAGEERFRLANIHDVRMKALYLRETEFESRSTEEVVRVSGLTLENVYGVPVISTTKEIRTRDERGVEVHVNKQRIAPFRAGQDPNPPTKLDLALYEPNYRKHPHGQYKGHIGKIDILSIEPDLGAYGIGKLEFTRWVGGNRATRSLAFQRKGPIKAGPLPELILRLKVTVPVVTGVYEGVVLVKPDATSEAHPSDKAR